MFKLFALKEDAQEWFWRFISDNNNLLSWTKSRSDHKVFLHKVLLHKMLIHKMLLHKVLPHKMLIHKMLLHKVLLHKMLIHKVLLVGYISGSQLLLQGTQVFHEILPRAPKKSALGGLSWIKFQFFFCYMVPNPHLLFSFAPSFVLQFAGIMSSSFDIGDAVLLRAREVFTYGTLKLKRWNILLLRQIKSVK